MPHDHPGFEYWDVTDAGFPFPVDVPQPGIQAINEFGGSAVAVLTVPDAQPTTKTVAERSIGYKASSQFWFALECTTANGVVTCQAVLRGRHVHWFPEHLGETEPGPVQEIRLSAAQMSGWGQKEVLAKHGQHCDSFFVSWAVNGLSVRCELTVVHILCTIPEWEAARAKAAREAEHKPPPEVPITPAPIPPGPMPPAPMPPPPEPMPPPQPGPDDEL